MLLQNEPCTRVRNLSCNPYRTLIVKLLALGYRVPEDCPAGVADLVKACTAHKASARPSAAEVVALLAGAAEVLEAPRPVLYEQNAGGDLVSFFSVFSPQVLSCPAEQVQS